MTRADLIESIYAWASRQPWDPSTQGRIAGAVVGLLGTAPWGEA
jgi:hypothetical protein